MSDFSFVDLTKQTEDLEIHRAKLEMYITLVKFLQDNSLQNKDPQFFTRTLVTQTEFLKTLYHSISFYKGHILASPTNLIVTQKQKQKIVELDPRLLEYFEKDFISLEETENKFSNNEDLVRFFIFLCTPKSPENFVEIFRQVDENPFNMNFTKDIQNLNHAYYEYTLLITQCCTETNVQDDISFLEETELVLFSFLKKILGIFYDFKHFWKPQTVALKYLLDIFFFAIHGKTEKLKYQTLNPEVFYSDLICKSILKESWVTYDKNTFILNDHRGGYLVLQKKLFFDICLSFSNITFIFLSKEENEIYFPESIANILLKK